MKLSSKYTFDFTNIANFFMQLLLLLLPMQMMRSVTSPQTRTTFCFDWSPKQMMVKLRDATPLVMNEYHVPSVAVKMNRFWSKLQDQLARTVNKCADLSETEKEVVRRSAEERGLLNDLELSGDWNDDMWIIFWGHATYIREALLQNPNCDNVNEWQYCDKVDSSGPTCNWLYYNWKGEAKANPRQSHSEFQAGGEYHPKQ